MRKLGFFFMLGLVVVAMFAVVSCNPETAKPKRPIDPTDTTKTDTTGGTVTPPPPPPRTTGDLKIFVRLNAKTGPAAPDAIIKLYHTENDMLTDQNMILDDVTDSAGYCLLKDLDPGTYYVHGEFNNQFGTFYVGETGQGAQNDAAAPTVDANKLRNYQLVIEP